MDVSLFDFELPQHLIAQTPLVDRKASRLMTLDRVTGEVAHRRFVDVLDYLSPGDCLVMNNTRVIPARLYGVKQGTGANVELLLLKDLGADRWEALARPGKRLKVGARVAFRFADGSEAPLTAEIVSEGEDGARVVQFAYTGIFHELLDRIGTMPLPPYIKERLEDPDRYQTVYAEHRGSAAAPTAGLHFTEDLLDQLRARGVVLAQITLHVGLGTFRPVAVERIEDHQMHAEHYEIPADTAAAVNKAVAEGRRVIAVGTTTARTLETAADEHGIIAASSGWTSIFIYPGYRFKLVDMLLTNFHLPQSTLLMMISALAGVEPVQQAYRQAVEHEYRFFSFGDAMLIHGPPRK